MSEVKRPFESFFFKVKIGNKDYSFQEVTGLEAEVEVEEIIEGGLNDHTHRLPKRIKYKNLVLKRGIVEKDSALIKWGSKTSLYEGFLNSSIKTEDILISLLNPKNSEEHLMKWSVKSAYPVKCSFSKLDAKESALLIETMELAFQSFKIE